MAHPGKRERKLRNLARRARRGERESVQLAQEQIVMGHMYEMEQQKVQHITKILLTLVAANNGRIEIPASMVDSVPLTARLRESYDVEKQMVVISAIMPKPVPAPVVEEQVPERIEVFDANGVAIKPAGQQ